jgi:hypothetical protein
MDWRAGEWRMRRRSGIREEFYRKGREGHKERKEKGLGVDDSFDAVFEEHLVEIDEEAEFALGELEVGEELGGVDGGQRLHRLKLDDEFAADDQVDAVVTEEVVLVGDVEDVFAFERDAAETELYAECALVNGFIQTRAEVLVDLNGGADDRMGQAICFCIDDIAGRIL